MMDTTECEQEIQIKKKGKQTKKCRRCRNEKPFEQFGKRTYKRGGVAALCLECAPKRGEYVISNKEQEEKLVIRRMLYGAERRARQKGLEFNITKEDIELPDVCPILGIELRKNSGKSSESSYSLDRKDSSKGYIKGNIQVISNRANTLKSNATIEELEKLLEYMKRHKEV